MMMTSTVFFCLRTHTITFRLHLQERSKGCRLLVGGIGVNPTIQITQRIITAHNRQLRRSEASLLSGGRY